MPRITALHAQKRDPERINVYIDGEFAFGVAALVVLQRGISVGGEVSTEDRAALQEADAQERFYGMALNFLSFRPRSRREVADFFRRKGVDDPVAEAVLQRLEGASLLDDREFAQFWVDNRQTFRPRGARALRAEMRGKGIANDVIDEALEALPDEEATAYEAARRKARTLRSGDPREFAVKLTGFLQRRGFSYATAAAVTKRLLAEVDAGDASDLEELGG